MGRSAGRSSARGHAGLRDIVERVARANPTGRGCKPAEEQARYAEKARLQSLLIESFPGEVRVQAHEGMPGVVSLSVPRLRASAAHAVVEALSDRARAWIQEQLEAAAEPGRAPAPPRGASPAPARGEPRLTRAADLIADYDFECAEAELASLAEDSAAAAEDRTRALLLLLELFVDHLANDAAALALEPALRALGPLSEGARELLGVAATRAGDTGAALAHLRRCGGERAAASLASLACASAGARAWADATAAWARLQSLALTAEPPAAASILSERDRARQHLEQLARRAREHELDADEDLVRFVRDLAPGHPWLRERRESAQKSRTEASMRALLERAEEHARGGDVASVEEVVELLSRAARTRSHGSDAARIAELAAWAEERRVDARAARALALAAERNADAACRVYATLPVPVRERLAAPGGATLFAALDSLNTALPDRAWSRPLVRAAAAFAAARERTCDPERWLLLEPHAALLEGVADLAPEVQRARALALTVEPPGARATAPAQVKAPREITLDGVKFLDGAPPSTGPIEIVDLGAFAVRACGASQVVTLASAGETGAWIVSLHLPGSPAPPRRIRIEGPVGFRRGCLLTTRQRIGLLDGSGALWMLTVCPELSVSKVSLAGAGVSAGQGEVVAVGENVLALGDRAAGLAPRAFRLVDASTGALLRDLGGEPLHRARTARGTGFHRVTGARVERLDAAGEVISGFDLPWGVSPSAILESPCASWPVLLSAPVDQGPCLLWWQAEGRFFRAFELFDASAHGAPIDAVALAEKGIWVVTQRSDGTAFLHAAQARKSMLWPAHRAVAATGHLGLVVDPAGRRGWSVRRTAAHGLDIRPLRLHDEHA